MSERLYLFGDYNPELAALIRDPGFRGVARKLFTAERAAPLPDPLPSSWERAVRAGLLTVEGDGYRCGPRLVPIPATAERELPEVMRSALRRYVEIAGEVVDELRSFYESSAPCEHFSWREVSHAVAFGMFLDMAMGREVVSSGEIAREPTGDSVVWAFEHVSAHNAYGVQLSADDDDRVFYAQLWHLDIHRDRGRLTSTMTQRLAQAAWGEEVEPSKELLYLRYVDLLRKEGSSWRVQIPAFGPADSERLLPILIRASRRLLADALIPALHGLVDHPWWRQRGQQDAYRHAVVRLMLEYGADRVISAGIVDPFPSPDELPSSWGRWLWADPEGELSLLPSRVTRNQGGASP